jgi:hypothetical protein
LRIFWCSLLSCWSIRLLFFFHTGRDPVQWVLEGSNTINSGVGGEWSVLHTQNKDYPVPVGRDQWILPLDQTGKIEL